MVEGMTPGKSFLVPPAVVVFGLIPASVFGV